MGSTDRMETPSGESFAREIDKLLERYADRVSEELNLLRLEGVLLAARFREWAFDPPDLDKRGPVIDELTKWYRSMNEAASRVPKRRV